MKKIRIIGAACVAVLWLALAVWAWVKPADQASEAERRPLEQMPALSAESILDGSFMTDFEDYTLDQFPLRDGFRTVKSLFHYNVLGQMDNNGIYVTDGYAAKLEYPYDPASVEYAISRFQRVYEKYLTGCNVYMAVVPDKGYYLAEENGYLAMDYEAMFADLESGMPWATHIDLTDCLDAEDYYRTDTHWRQENLLPVAERICEALGVTAPDGADFTQTAVERPFYGVYYGQAALPMAAETMYLMESDLLNACRVYDFESGSYGTVYDSGKLESADLYDVFLSGSRSLLTIENPNAAAERELIVFRDSFGSSIVPLLVQDYARVTLVDIRYISPEVLGNFIEFGGQDVLFLYSTLVLNNSEIIK